MSYKIEIYYKVIAKATTISLNLYLIYELANNLRVKYSDVTLNSPVQTYFFVKVIIIVKLFKVCVFNVDEFMINIKVPFKDHND